MAFFASSFICPFQSFLITLGVPIAAWAGILIADVLSRRAVYDEQALFDPRGRYGAFDWTSIITMVLAVQSKAPYRPRRSEEHTSELQSRGHLVCRLLLEKKKKQN